MMSFLNLSKGTIKRHRRQQIDNPSSDFGLQKARAATRERIKDSMRPFDNDSSLTFKPVSASSLFEEFINMMKGSFKKDMLEYIVKEAKTLPIIDIEFVNEKRTYSKSELDEFSKQIGFTENECDINSLLSQCHNFVLNEPIITCSKPIYETDLPNKAMDIDLPGEHGNPMNGQAVVHRENAGGLGNQNEGLNIKNAGIGVNVDSVHVDLPGSHDNPLGGTPVIHR